ncbi:MAG: GNAT family N-acetyltransferase [Saprospiraceae bacterium]|nr:GNAT family N-acetyltransferase [Candidatus Vicinibacter affinis]MBP6172120.1 GNAT family N-acetyltransferase [Saprospiraceae bacterium]MBK6571182.1 GNAT family N-acetyltransferase [Candidatus Vicinibacter affinis]MBK7304916.1 GNAT family N-acetyltransferase [Candidatus Vicinibacter affinis]MBK7694681.1 GNAT family N-acetyltransferase [Candidatus Vicinibacter affinis]
MITLRKINKADSSSIFDLVMELAVFEKSASAVKTCPEDFESNYEKGIFDGFVAEVTGQGIVGMALFFSYFSTWNGFTIYLEDLYVKEDHRGKEIGKMLFEEVLNHAKAHDAKMVKWQVLDWNESAKNFYHKFGSIFIKGWENGVIYLNEKV